MQKLILDTTVTLTRDELVSLISEPSTSSTIVSKAREALTALDAKNNNLAELNAEIKALADRAAGMGIQWPTIYAWESVMGGNMVFARAEIDRYAPRGKYPIYQRDPKTQGGPAEFGGWHQVDTVTNPDALRTMKASIIHQIANKNAGRSPLLA